MIGRLLASAILLVAGVFAANSIAADAEVPSDAHWVGATAPHYGSDPQYSAGERIESRDLAMRDGIRIAVDVYLPKNREPEARFPAMLIQTPYYRSVELTEMAAMLSDGTPPREAKRRNLFVRNGYAWVVSDVRGTGASFGARDYPFTQDEIRDGSDIVDWIINQPWSNGRVGATGISYVGTTADFLATLEHPAVKATAPLFSLFDAYEDGTMPGGVNAIWMPKTYAKSIERLDLNRLAEELKGREGDKENSLARQLVGVRPVDADTDKELLAQRCATMWVISTWWSSRCYPPTAIYRIRTSRPLPRWTAAASICTSTEWSGPVSLSTATADGSTVGSSRGRLSGI